MAESDRLHLTMQCDLEKIPCNILRQKLTKTEKLHNDICVITICLAKLLFEEVDERTNVVFFQCSFICNVGKGAN